MMEEEKSYKTKKVITIGVVSELTGLSERQIRYYESRQLIFPERSDRGTRKYSFADVEALMEIASLMEEGGRTFEIRQELKKSMTNEQKIRDNMIKGQLNAQFGVRKP
jgi:MerR family transcriptional regulator, global nitrogen regulator